MKYYGSRSVRNTGITKWRQPSRNPDLNNCAKTYEEFSEIMVCRLNELGPCILPGGKGQPQIIISSKYTKLKTVKGEWPILRTGIISEYHSWATQLIQENPNKFSPMIVVYKRTIHQNKMRSEHRRSGPESIYFIGSDETTYVKIGTTIDIGKRLSGIQTSIPFDLKILLVIPGGKKEEKLTHSAFEVYRKRGEWFKIEGKLKRYLEFMANDNNPHIEPWEWEESR